MKILLHVTYHEGPGAEKLKRLFRLAKENGCDGVELRKAYRWKDMSNNDYYNLVAGLKAEYPQMEIVFNGIVELYGGAPAEIDHRIAEYCELLKWAKKECGCKVINMACGVIMAPGKSEHDFHFHGSAYAKEEDFKRIAGSLRKIGDAAAALDMLVALEMHGWAIHDLAAPSRKLMDITGHDAVGLNHDHGNIFIHRDGESIQSVFEILRNKVYYAHLKNMMSVSGGAGGYLCTRLADGHINTMEVMENLNKYCRSGMAAIEYPNKGDGILAAKLDMEYIRYIKEQTGIN